VPSVSTRALLAVWAFILAGDEARVRRLLHAGKASMASWLQVISTELARCFVDEIGTETCRMPAACQPHEAAPAAKRFDNG
jgi:hypothetical protein